MILADEVGLGKTIEAGIVLCQLWAERKRRLLVICPASLRKQWAMELEVNLIYVNGGNNLENLKTPDDLWKVRLIEEDFHRLMFEIHP